MLSGDDVHITPAGIWVEVGSTGIRACLVVWIKISRHESGPSRSSIIGIELSGYSKVIKTSEEVDCRQDFLEDVSQWQNIKHT